jgi:Zn-dependent peptidase ImmA (M78 family)
MAEELGISTPKLLGRALQSRHVGTDGDSGDRNVSGTLEDFAESLESLDAPDSKERVRLAPVEPRSREELEEFGNKVASRLFRIRVDQGRKIPICQLLGGNRAPNLESVSTHDLPITTETLSRSEMEPGEACVGYNDRGQGKIIVYIRDDVLERAKSGDGRSRFSCAHEIAHAIFHGEEIREELQGRNGVVLRDEANTATEQLPDDIPIYRSEEYQANTIASALLMPLKALKVFLSNIGIRGPHGVPIHRVAEHFEVSHQAARIRIQQILPKLANPTSSNNLNDEGNQEEAGSSRS